MAHKKAGGSSRNGRDSNAKRLGVKAYGGEIGERRPDHRAPARHAWCIPASTSASGRDHTLYARVAGKVEFAVKGAGNKKTVSILPA